MSSMKIGAVKVVYILRA